MVRLITYVITRKSFLKRLFTGLLTGILIFDFFAVRVDNQFFGDSMNCFWALFAGVGSLTLIVFCKGIYHVLLMRDTDYYDT